MKMETQRTVGVTIDDIRAAAAAQAEHLDRTDVRYSQVFSEMLGAEIFFKLEIFQRTGSFKSRGSLTKLLRLPADVRARGVVTASAGNHGQGVALAARLLGVPATIVMPVGAPLYKVTAVQHYGAEVVLHGATYDDSHTHAFGLATERNAAYIHAFDDPDVIAGQGVVGLELAEQLPDLDVVLVPVGGGGLIAGVSTAVKALAPRVRVIGVQASGAAACSDSFRKGSLVETAGVQTIADGIAVKRPGEFTFPIIREFVDDMVTVDDDAISQAIVMLMERAKLVVEGAGAVGVAALLAGRVAHGGRRVGVVLSGGNVDLNLLGKVIQYGMITAGRYLTLRLWLEDKPGQLFGITSTLAEHNVNIIHVGIHRIGPYMALHHVELELIVETRDVAHGNEVLALLRKAGYAAEEASEIMERARNTLRDNGRGGLGALV
jgi:threonine dehydratase